MISVGSVVQIYSGPPAFASLELSRKRGFGWAGRDSDGDDGEGYRDGAPKGA